MNCPSCEASIPDALVIHHATSIFAKRRKSTKGTHRKPLETCSKCGTVTTHRELTRHPKCPHATKGTK